MGSILIELGALMRSTPTTLAPAGEVAAWCDAKAAVLTRMARHNTTLAEDVLRLAGQARAARQHAARVRSTASADPVPAGDSCLDHTAWGCPLLPAALRAA